MIPVRRRKLERGQSLTEMALVLPVLLLILLAILDFGRAVYAYHVVANCAREGARVGAIPTNGTADILARVNAMAVGLNAPDLTVGVSRPTATTIRVDVSYRFRLVTPFVANILGRSTLVLHSASTMYTGY